MSSTSTNKQSMLVDRPLLEVVTLGSTPCLTTTGNYNTPAASGLLLLVDPGPDGAVLDSASIVALEATLTASSVLLFMSTTASASTINASNTFFVAGVAIGSTTVGQRTNIPLPPLSVPVPHLAGPAATLATYPSETDKKNTGLYIPYGKYLYAGTDVALFSPLASSRVNVIAQGGYY